VALRLGSEKGNERVEDVFKAGVDVGRVLLIVEELGIGNGLQVASDIEPANREDTEDNGKLEFSVLETTGVDAFAESVMLPLLPVEEVIAVLLLIVMVVALPVDETSTLEVGAKLGELLDVAFDEEGGNGAKRRG
jgi:hypothetical protein